MNTTPQTKQGHLRPSRKVSSAHLGAGYFGDGPPDPRLRPGSATCLCTGCNEYFNSVAAFDMHRTGEGPDRRCLTVLEMVAAGMSKNDRDLWVTKAYEPGIYRQEESGT